MNTLPDIPRLYTALAEWLACLVYLPLISCKRWTGRTWTALGLALVWQSVFLAVTRDLPIAWWVPCMIAAQLFMYMLLLYCGGCGAVDAGYYCVQAFVLAEFSASLEWQLHCFLWPDHAPQAWQALILLATVYAAVYLLVAWLNRRTGTAEKRLELTVKELGTCIVIGAAVFAASNLGFLSANTPISGSYTIDVYIIRTIIDLGGLAILYAHGAQCRELRTRRELEAVQAAMRAQYQQYQLSRETVELIDRKYHDLKHHIMVLRSELSDGQRTAYLDQMEEDIRIYEAQNKTGNQVLDTILTSKSLACARQGISLTCVADGRLLDFMDAMDLSSVFGNILDNAMECELNIPEREKRLIHMSVSAQRGFTLIHVENYCENAVDFGEGLPRTTKADPAFHGYGLKSVRFVAQKYGGTVTVKTEGSWFVLRILLPQPR